MGIDERNSSEVFVDEEPYRVIMDTVIPFQPRESAKAVQARLDRMAELGCLIPRVSVDTPPDSPYA